MQWTSQQEKVIQSRKRNLLVSAAAGSGKTAVLVERIVRMITDPKNPVDLDRLLVMTFTSAAAGEMRERVGKAIEEKIGCRAGKPAAQSPGGPGASCPDSNDRQFLPVFDPKPLRQPGH